VRFSLREYALTPSRICDTRPASITGYTTECTPHGALTPGQTISFQVTGVGLVPTVADVTAVAINVTATDTSTAGFFSVYPQGGSTPTASNVNLSAGNTVPNRVIVPVSSTGEVTIDNNVGHTDVVVDVNGYFTTGATAPSNETLFTPVAPVRILDTRSTHQPLAPGATLSEQIAGIADLYPFGGSATAVALNATVTDPTAPSFLTIYPGGTRPTTSDVNWSAGETVPNFTITSLSSSGAITLYNEHGSTNVVLDVFGFFSPD